MSWVRDLNNAQYVIDSVQRQNQSLSKNVSGTTRWSNSKVPRVTQLDALTTQADLRSLLTESLARVFAVAPLSSIPYTYQEELHLALDLVLFRYSTYRLGASVGDRLHNLVVRDELTARAYGKEHVSHLVPLFCPSRHLLILYGILDLLVPYILKKLQRRAFEENWAADEESSWRSRFAKSLHYILIAWSTMSLLNTIHFLTTGQYRTLVERLLGLHMVNGSQQVMRLTNLMYLNQIITSQAFQSLIEVFQLGNFIKKITRTAYAFGTHHEAAPENRCCACYELPTISQRSSCGHLYCYYCIRSRLLQYEAEGSFPCLRCGKRVVSCEPDQ